ncbi:MAG: class I SAM-dependent methyltransferase, partial [Intestinibacter sp.]|uniref:class I SAM-dependent methyltransferase n=1 Tax=Intestinibacter sp. TaxID=1965304 RepID=UPI003F18F12D
ASLGHKVVGIDLTKSMIDRAKQIADMLDYDIDFRVMNAQELDFDDEEFDVVISRNLTWTLPNIEKAYREWYRVLRKDGVLLNFDADYGKVSFNEEAKTLGKEHVHSKIETDLMKECDEIKEELVISKRQRPVWDEKYLKQIGFKSCITDCKVSERIYKIKDDFYNPTPMFKVYAAKIAN